MRHHAAASTGAGASATDPLRTRRFFLGGLAVGLFAMSAVGLATAAFVESPQQVAARSAAPAPTLITAAARWQVLRNVITVPGIVRSARRIEVTASAPYQTVTVTRLPVRPGDRVRPGQLLAEIDGRPIVALRGRLPPYRDLREGDAGPDVTQLQRALESLGYADFDPPGELGPSTALALLLFYRHLGYHAPIFRRAVGVPGAGPRVAPRPAGHAIAARRTATGLVIPSAYLPMSEVVFIPARSALVVSVGARVGGRAGGSPVLTLSTGRPQVSGSLTAHQAALARPGTPALIAASNPPLTVAGTVTRVGSLTAPGGPRGVPGGRPPGPAPRGVPGGRPPGPAPRGVPGGRPPGPARSAGGYPVLVASRRPLPQRLVGAGVRLRLEPAVTAGPVLTVPVAAIIGGTHGRPARVVKILPPRRRVRVPVFTGPAANGLVAVQPVGPGALRPGDRVLVGVGR